MSKHVRNNRHRTRCSIQDGGATRRGRVLTTLALTLTYATQPFGIPLAGTDERNVEVAHVFSVLALATCISTAVQYAVIMSQPEAGERTL